MGVRIGDDDEVRYDPEAGHPQPSRDPNDVDSRRDHEKVFRPNSSI